MKIISAPSCSKIKVNSWECAKGKTRQWIYPNIHNLLKYHQKILLVVPSIELQDQYHSDFINQITVINKNTTSSVCNQVYATLEDRQNFICITQQAFILLNLPNSIKRDYTLIIDEVFDPIRIQKINITETEWKLDFRFDQIFKMKDTTYLDELNPKEYSNIKDWFEIDVINPDPDREKAFINDSKSWKNLMTTNHKTFMTLSAYHKLCEAKQSQIAIIQTLKTNILNGWEQIYIAAAKFESTFMNYWMKANDFHYEIVGEFTRHTTKITFHMSTDESFRWTKCKKDNDKGILESYHNYVDKQTKDICKMVIRNNLEAQHLVNEYRISHNVHGMNNLTEYTHISLETALISDPLLKQFYKHNYDMTDEQITGAYSGQLFYQVIMRSAMRLNIPVNVYMLDVDTWIELLDYFDESEVEAVIPLIINPKGKPGRPKKSKKQKIISAEVRKEYIRAYRKKYREKLKTKGHST